MCTDNHTYRRRYGPHKDDAGHRSDPARAEGGPPIRLRHHGRDGPRERHRVPGPQTTRGGSAPARTVGGIQRGRDGDAIKVFFLTCVIVAGVFGALTANPRIIIVQGAPAILALISVFIAQQLARKRRNPDST